MTVRQLQKATFDMMRARGGSRVQLGVIDGNTPAQPPDRSLGFVEYGGGARCALTPTGSVACPALPAGFEELALGEFEWKTRYELDKRIVPATLQEFEPIVAGRYKTPAAIRALAPVFRFVETTPDCDVVVRRTADHVGVGRAGWSVSKRGSGTNQIRVRLDPACAAIAPYLVCRALREVLTKSPAPRVETLLPSWMLEAAREFEALGFVRRSANPSMGMKLWLVIPPAR